MLARMLLGYGVIIAFALFLIFVAPKLVPWPWKTRTRAKH